MWSRLFGGLALTALVSATSPFLSTYYPEYNAKYLAPSAVPYSKLNDISYFVAVPTSSGPLKPLNHTVATQIVTLAHQHKVNVTLVVGGWTGSQYFSSLVASASTRKVLLASILSTIQSYGFDGLQIDWEYPGTQGIGCNQVSSNDVANLLTFFQEARKALGPTKRLSAAVSVNGFYKTASAVEFAKVLSDIMLMTYDVVGPGWSTLTGPNAPLRVCSSVAPASVDQAVQLWRKAGFAANRIIVGLPNYGYGYSGVSNLTTTIKSGYKTQMYNSYTGSIGGSTQDPAGKDICGNQQPAGGQFLFKELISSGRLNKNGLQGAGTYERYFDTCTSTPFLYSSKDKVFISYDDPQSVAAKAQYVKSNGLLGVSYFDATGDAGTLLLDAARNVLLGSAASVSANKANVQILPAAHNAKVTKKSSKHSHRL